MVKFVDRLNDYYFVYWSIYQVNKKELDDRNTLKITLFIRPLRKN